MATRKPSQAQQSPAVNPFAAAVPGLDLWRSMFEAQNTRFEQMVSELERLEKERHEARYNPEYFKTEAAGILTLHGVDAGDAREIAATMARHPDFMADFMMQYRIGMADPTTDGPAARGAMTFISFVVFGAAPLLPYFLLDPVPATFLVSVFATFAALVALGTLRWQVTDATLARAVGESVLVGGICAAVAYGVGVAFRV